MTNFDYNEYLFAILHYDVFVKDTDTPLDESYDDYSKLYNEYIASKISKDYSISTYDSMVRFLEYKQKYNSIMENFIKAHVPKHLANTAHEILSETLRMVESYSIENNVSITAELVSKCIFKVLEVRNKEYSDELYQNTLSMQLEQII